MNHEELTLAGVRKSLDELPGSLREAVTAYLR
jgi:hypothetical protein